MNMQISEEDLRIFFSKNSDYYIEKWNEVSGGKKFIFKPYAFLFGWFWFLYRKMYREVFLFLLVIMIYGFVYEFFLIELLQLTETGRILIDCISSCLVTFLCGSFGNYLYIKSSERKIAKILSKDLSDEEKKKALKNVGGTSYLFFIIMILIIIAVVFINNFIEE